MKFGLETISRLTAALGHPERAFRSVLVGGTNGKGSVTAMVHHALLAAGHRSARYTSPHLERLEERYVVGADDADPDALEAAAGAVRDAVHELQRRGELTAPPTFFECATAAAFELFRRAAVDIAVLEVGLGGRLDATNIVTPLAAAIVSIDFDHQAQLGSTLESIAFEKAGIVKPGIAVVCGDLPAEADAVVRAVCEARGARFVQASRAVSLDALVGSRPLGLAGGHQRSNARVAAGLLREIDRAGVGVGDEAIRAGLCDVRWPGRLERFEFRGAEVLIDAAHNPAGSRALASFLAEAGWEGCTLVFGALEDKDAAGMLPPLAEVCRAIVCTTPESPRARAAEAVAALAREVPGARWDVSAEPRPEAALAAAAARARRIVAAGSIFLIGPLRGILRTR